MLIVLLKKNFVLEEVDNEDLKLLIKNPNKFWKGIEVVKENAFNNCKDLEVLSVPSFVSFFGNQDFGKCDKLREISFYKDTEVKYLDNCKFKYLYKLDDRLIFTNEIMENELDKKEIYNVLKCLKEIPFKCFFSDDINNYIALADKLAKNNVIFPYGIIEGAKNNKCHLKNEHFICDDIKKDTSKDVLDYFTLEASYKQFKNIIKLAPFKLRYIDIVSLYKIGYALGLFDSEKVIKTGSSTYSPVCNVAYTFLQGVIKKGELSFLDLESRFNDMNLYGYNEEFLKFMVNNDNSVFNSEGKFFICHIYDWFLERTYLGLDLNYGDISLPSSESERFKIMTFNKGDKEYYKVRWNKPTVKLLVDSFVSKAFDDVSNKEMAKYFVKYGSYSERHLNKAIEIDEERKSKNVSDYIIAGGLKENYVDSLNDYKRRIEQLDNEISKSGHNIIKNQRDIAFNIFTYEMLSKSDFVNYFLGFLTDCCLNLYGSGSGAQRAMIVDKDIQPLVIRNSANNIICVGILYINRKEGYGVVNSFELNKKYLDDYASREEIYTKIKQMVKEIANKYNKENKSNPLKKITCGLSVNHDGINEFIKKEKKEENLLRAPDFSKYSYISSEYWAGDWHLEQFVLWEKNKNR